MNPETKQGVIEDHVCFSVCNEVDKGRPIQPSDANAIPFVMPEAFLLKVDKS